MRKIHTRLRNTLTLTLLRSPSPAAIHILLSYCTRVGTGIVVVAQLSIGFRRPFPRCHTVLRDCVTGSRRRAWLAPIIWFTLSLARLPMCRPSSLVLLQPAQLTTQNGVCWRILFCTSRRSTQAIREAFAMCGQVLLAHSEHCDGPGSLPCFRNKCYP